MPNRSTLYSRRAAAMVLGVHPETLDKIAAANKLKVWQIPGHSRKFYAKVDIDRLVAATMTTATAVPTRKRSS